MACLSEKQLIGILMMTYYGDETSTQAEVQFDGEQNPSKIQQTFSNVADI